MTAAAVIFRLVLASLVTFWVPAQCCDAGSGGNAEASVVRVVTAADAADAAACEKPCCGVSTSHDTPVMQSHDKPCDCDHPTPAKLAVVDGGRISITPSAVGGLVAFLPPLSIYVTAAGFDGVPPSLHQTASSIDPVPTVTLRGLCVLLTV